MLFRSSVALLLIFSLASINAQPFDRRGAATGTLQASPGDSPGGDGKMFSKVIACVLEKSKPATPAPSPQQAAPVGDEPTAPLILFDKCVREIYNVPQTPAGSSTSGSTGEPADTAR